MPDLKSSFSFPSCNDSTAAVRDRSSKLKSWLKQASGSVLVPPSHHSRHAQIHSQFFITLPIEIRCQIYADVLHSFGTVQHILLSNRKLTHMRCASPTPHTYFEAQYARNNACVPYDAAYRKSMRNSWEILPLLLSCRQTYLEFIGIIYSSTTLHLPIIAATQLIATVPAPHIALARLHISYSLTEPMYLPPHAWPIGFTAANSNPRADEAEWEALWRAFARLRVRALVVEILDMGVRVPEQTLLRPLRNLKAEFFEVVLPWPTGLETTGEFGNAEFLVRRPPDGTDLMMQVNVEKGYPGVGKPRGIWERLRKR